MSDMARDRASSPQTGFGSAMGENREALPALRRSQILELARIEGLIGAQKNRRISGRVSARLLKAAKQRAALTSDNAVIEYALARLAVEENYGERLFRHEGKVPQDLDLEF